jgi:hypothetical protein
VRNPVLGLPAVKAAIAEMTPDDRRRWRRILFAIRDDARGRAEQCWRKHKAPMAVYWKVVGVISNHLARALAPSPQHGEPNG